MEAVVNRIIVLGGLGLFGRTVAEQLRQEGLNPLTASRRAAADLQIDANDPASIRAALAPGDLIVDAAGPFQMRTTALMEAAIEIGFDVIDLNDDLRYAESIIALEQRIADAGIRMLSSASSVSAVAAAVVRHSGIEMPRRVTAFLAPASRYTANPGTAASLWRSIGRPVRVLRDGKMQTQVGWSDSRNFVMPRPVGKIKGFLFESADTVFLPKIWPMLRDVSMYVDTNTFGGNRLLQLAAYSEPIREVMRQRVHLGAWLARKVGSTAGGVGYEIEGPDGRVTRHAIVAAENSYLAAIAPAVLAAKAIARDEFPSRGLILPHHQVEPPELFRFLAARAVHLKDAT